VRRVVGAEANERAKDEQGGDERDVRGAHLPLSKHTDQAKMVVAAGIVMKRLMECVAD
jgi:hypothetical protein